MLFLFCWEQIVGLDSIICLKICHRVISLCPMGYWRGAKGLLRNNPNLLKCIAVHHAINCIFSFCYIWQSFDGLCSHWTLVHELQTIIEDEANASQCFLVFVWSRSADPSWQYKVQNAVQSRDEPISERAHRLFSLIGICGESIKCLCLVQVAMNPTIMYEFCNR